MNLWQMSISGAVMIVVILIVRAAAINRLPKMTFYLLWGVVLARLLLPFSLPAACSVYSLAERLGIHEIVEAFVPRFAFSEKTAWDEEARAIDIGLSEVAAQQAAGLTADDTMAEETSAQGSDMTTAASTTGNAAAETSREVATSYAAAYKDRREPSYLWKIVWLSGFLLCGTYFTVAYLRCLQRFRESLPVEQEFAKGWLEEHRLWRSVALRCSDRISAPLTFGILRPVILVPKNFEQGEKSDTDFMLAHELVHVRRFDAAWKLLLTLALCLHWFNPAVWLMYVFADRDMELSCDEAVVRLFGEEAKSDYAMTLLRMEEERSAFAPLFNGFSKNVMEERIVAIMKIKKFTIPAGFAAAGLIVGVTLCFATTAQADHTASHEALGYETAAGYDVQWWTADEYEKWLEQEKKELAAIIGEKGWNQTEGWYTWTQERVDEAIAMYEQTLRDIQNGHKISKPMPDGDTVVQFGYEPGAVETAAEDRVEVAYASEALTQEVAEISEGDEVAAYNAYGNGALAQETTETLEGDEIAAHTANENTAAYAGGDPNALSHDTSYEEYSAFGITFENGKMYYQGKPVRVFFDCVESADGNQVINHLYTCDEGTECIRTVRARKNNGDGSYDPFGPIQEIIPTEDMDWNNLNFQN